MSTKAVVENADDVTAALHAVRDDQNGVERKAWAVLGHVENDPLRVALLAHDASAEASLAHMREHLKDDQVCYCLMRLTTPFDMSTTVKFIYVHWMGKSLPFVKRGRYGVVHGSVQELFNPYHLFVETDNTAEIDDEVLIKQLDESSGVRTKVIEGSIEGRQERGFTAHQTTRQSTQAPRSVAPTGLSVQLSPELQAGIADVRADASSTRWVVGGFEEGNLKKPIGLVATGEGNIEELKSSLEDNKVLYCLYRTTDTIDDICTVKFVYIYWIGETVKPMTKGKVSAYASPVEQAFGAAATTLMPMDRDDLTEEKVMEKVQLGSGTKSRVK